jgi:hypothetical protein
MLKRADLRARILPLADEGREALETYGTPAQRLELLGELSREMWLLAAKPLPDYLRSEIPVAVFVRETGRR